jgi:hypothetical protein
LSKVQRYAKVCDNVNPIFIEAIGRGVPDFGSRAASESERHESRFHHDAASRHDSKTSQTVGII